MKTTSITYRSLCAFTALVMLLSITAPAGLHALGLAGCAMNAMEHDKSPVPEVTDADHCDLAAHHEARHNDTDTGADPAMEECDLDYNCSCTADETAVKANAIPTPSKISAGFIPSVIQTVDFSPGSKHVNSTEPVFVSLYSPPLFLQNSSFLN